MSSRFFDEGFEFGQDFLLGLFVGRAFIGPVPSRMNHVPNGTLLVKPASAGGVVAKPFQGAVPRRQQVKTSASPMLTTKQFFFLLVKFFNRNYASVFQVCEFLDFVRF